jgi:hypothetical protein
MIVAISLLDTEVEFCIICDTDFVMPRMPSPMIISVSSPTRSTKCVCLKLTTLHTQEIVMTARVSTHTTTYLIMLGSSIDPE